MRLGFECSILRLSPDRVREPAPQQHDGQRTPLARTRSVTSRLRLAGGRNAARRTRSSTNAPVTELADVRGSGPRVFGREGSNPSWGTTHRVTCDADLCGTDGAAPGAVAVPRQARRPAVTSFARCGLNVAPFRHRREPRTWPGRLLAVLTAQQPDGRGGARRPSATDRAGSST